jgi:cyclopropane fatty-acyl-phospholipid synthase-like methyltransferase
MSCASSITIPEEYRRYSASSVMQQLARAAHGREYIGQTSSATPQEVFTTLQRLQLPPHVRIMDAGCGNGCFAIQIAAHFHADVVGVDLSESLIRQATLDAEASSVSARCRFVVGDFSTTAFGAEAFDVILSIGSLYWGSDVGSMLDHWRTLLARNSAIVIYANLSASRLDAEEITAIGRTRFIEESELLDAFGALGMAVEKFDQTEIYQHWLERWCEAMRQNATEIDDEMGRTAGEALRTRFETYLRLAQCRKVKRDVIVARRN